MSGVFYVFFSFLTVFFNLFVFAHKKQLKKKLNSYIGHESGGQLTEAVRRRPYSVVLFDEIEKAHADVLNVLLQVLDDGRLTDSLGKTVSFENTMIVLTSNVGATILLDQSLPAKAKKDAVLAAARAHFRPELLNRLDDIIVFDALTPEMLVDVARIQAKGLEARLLARGVGLEFSDAALAWAAARSFDPSYGARPLRRWLEKNVVTALSRKLISGEVEEGDLVVVGVSPDAAAKAERKQKSRGAQSAVTSDEEEGWVSVEEDGDSGLVYDVKKGKGPPIAGAEASGAAPSTAAGIKRSKMETAPSDALTETEEEMED